MTVNIGKSWSKIKPLLVFLVPLVLLPLPLIQKDSVATFAYCLSIIAIFWVFEILNIYVTSLLPMILLPLAGIAKPSSLAKEYMPDVCMLFIGTLILACGVEKTGVHRRMALLTLKVFGGSTRSLMFGLMLVSWFLSMWISNTATTALMLPVIEAIFGVFEGKLKKTESDSENSKSKLPDSITKGLTLAIAYGANIGGMGTLTGTPPNLVCSSLMDENFPCYEPKLSYANWLIFALPISVVFFILTYCYMNVYWFGLPFSKRNSKKYQEFGGDEILQVINQQYNSLPKMAFNEYYCVFTLILMVTLMFFKSPGFMTGWADLYPTAEKPSDSTIALLLAGLLFFVPSKFETNFKKLDFSRPIITWKEFQNHCPWGTIILIGSGVALSETSTTSGFSQYIADLLEDLAGLPRVAILYISGPASSSSFFDI